MKQIDKQAKAFCKKIDNPMSINAVQQYIKDSGYEIIKFNNETEELFEFLGLDKSLKSRHSFTFINKSRRIVFINSQNTAIFSYLMEAAHIWLKHQPINCIVGNNKEQMLAASAFCSYINFRDFYYRKSSRRILICAIIALVILATNVLSLYTIYSRTKLISTSPTAILQGTAETSFVFITKSGDKYHLPDCIYAENGFRIPLNTATAHGYEPCKICN